MAELTVALFECRPLVPRRLLPFHPVQSVMIEDKGASVEVTAGHDHERFERLAGVDESGLARQQANGAGMMSLSTHLSDQVCGCFHRLEL